MAFDESAVVWKHLDVEAREFVSKANKRGGGTQRRIQRKEGNLSSWTLQLIDIAYVEELLQAKRDYENREKYILISKIMKLSF